MRTTPISCSAVLLLFTVFACRKAISVDNSKISAADSLNVTQLISSVDTTGNPAYVPYPENGLRDCFPTPLYGDSVLYPQPTSGADDIVSPVVNPGPGHYLSWPSGLSLDPATGAINLTKSHTGQRYAVGYIKDGTNDTCLTSVIIGGADYADSVYVLASGSTIAVPYFDANIYGVSNCSGPGNSGHCSFDLTNAATNQRLAIDKFSGEIDLVKTLNGKANMTGIFGISPQSGSIVTATISYSLVKGSNSAVQSMDIYLAYYDSKSQVNSDVLNLIQSRLNNILIGNLISKNFNTRPPLIIIVRKF